MYRFCLKAERLRNEKVTGGWSDGGRQTSVQLSDGPRLTDILAEKLLRSRRTAVMRRNTFKKLFQLAEHIFEPGDDCT